MAVNGVADNLSPLQFLQNYYGCEDCSISYRPYEYGAFVETMRMERAVEKMEQDIKDMVDFFRCYGIEDKAKEAVFSIWEKHLVKFPSKKG